MFSSQKTCLPDVTGCVEPCLRVERQPVGSTATVRRHAEAGAICKRHGCDGILGEDNNLINDAKGIKMY